MKTETKTAHTPGPWKVAGDAGREQWCPITSKGGDVAFTPNGKQGVADATLVAAAPDLLAALKDSVGFVEAWSMALNDSGKTAASQIALKSWDKMKAAIAKAEGHDKRKPVALSDDECESVWKRAERNNI